MNSAEIDRALLEARQELDHLVSDFMTIGHDVESRIKLINALFLVWLNKEFRKSTKEHGASVILNTTEVIEFLLEFNQKWKAVKNWECRKARRD